MRDITQEMRDQDFQRALREYAELLKVKSEVYERRAEHSDDLMDRASNRGVAEGLLLASEALASASQWDTPDRPRHVKPPEDPTLEARRSWQAYYDAGLPWTGEFEDAVNRGEVDVS